MSKLTSVLVTAGALIAAVVSYNAHAGPGLVDVNVVNAPTRQPFEITRSCITNGQKSCSIPRINVPAVLLADGQDFLSEAMHVYSDAGAASSCPRYSARLRTAVWR